MGRPKGSKNKPKQPTITTNIFSIEKSPQVDESEKQKKVKPIKIKCNCDVCNSDIYCDPIKVDIGNLTGMAKWHRNCSKDKFYLCQKCSNEFNSMIDNWFINKNPQLIKFK